MSSWRVIRLLIFGLVGSLTAGSAWGFDLGAPLKAVEKLLGHGGKEAPARPGETDATRRTPQAPGIPITPDAEPSQATLAGETAPMDTVTAQMLDEILLSPEPYYYQMEGRRDPFVSLVGEEAEADQEMAPAEIFVRGILWGERDRFALVETSEGESFILREGDRLGAFSVTRVDPDGIVVYTSEYGVGKTIRLPLAEGKGKKHARSQR